jgi:hypothetical protein
MSHLIQFSLDGYRTNEALCIAYTASDGHANKIINLVYLFALFAGYEVTHGYATF